MHAGLLSKQLGKIRHSVDEQLKINQTNWLAH